MAITNRDFDVAVRLLSGGTNEAIYNDVGLPSIMVRKDKKQISEVIADGSASTHPAFIVDGAEVPAFYMSKFLNVVYKGRAYSLPMQDPGNSINFDNAKKACELNGPGFHLPTIAEYSFIAQEARNRGTMPRGNNQYGKDYSAPWEKGIPTFMSDATTIVRVATGSGPVSWSDNWQEDGIWDLNGNVYEWQGAYRTVNGEIQIIPDNDAAKQILQNPESTLWKAIMPDGSLADPGTAGTLKLDYVGGKWTIATAITSQEDSSRYCTFETMTVAAGVTVPEILKVLALFPAEAGDHGGDYFYANNGAAERLAFRGGSWSGTSHAGVFSVCGDSSRSYSGPSIGFRSAYIPGI